MGPGSLSSPYALKRHVDGRLIRTHHGVGDADGAAAKLPRAEIGMDANGAADEINERGGIGVHCGGGNILIPGIIRREGKEAVEACARSDAHAAACAGLRRSVHGQVDRGGSAGAGIWIGDRHGISS